MIESKTRCYSSSPPMFLSVFNGFQKESHAFSINILVQYYLLRDTTSQKTRIRASGNSSIAYGKQTQWE